MNKFEVFQLRVQWVCFVEEENIDNAVKSYELYKAKVLNGHKEKELEYSSKLFQEKIVTLGDKFLKEKDYVEAIKAFSAAFKNNDRDIECIKKYANCLDELKQYDLAILLYEYLLEIEKDIEPYFLIAKVYEKQKMYDKSIEFMKKYIELKGWNVNASDYNCLGYFYSLYYRKVTHKLSDLEKSITFYIKASNMLPSNIIYAKNAAIALMNGNNLKEGKKFWDRLFQINQINDTCKYDYSAFCLKSGDFKEWHKYFDTRFTKNNPVLIPKINKPKWDGGQDLSNSTLLIHYELGFGDTFWLWGYVPRVAKIAKKVIFIVQKEIYELLKNNEFDVEVYSDKNIDLKKLEFDYYIPSMSLPAALNLDRSNFSVGQGYIKPDNNLVEKFKNQYFNNDKLKIGLSFQGNKNRERDRDIPIKEFLLLDELNNIEIYNLTKDVPDSEFEIFNKHKVVNIVKESKNFADTAAMIANCDLVLTSDNCIMNLSGAIGKKTFAIFNWINDFRWFDLTGDDVVYYTCVKPYVCDDIDNWRYAMKLAVKEIKQRYSI